MSTTTHLMTAEDLLKMPDDGYRHELIKGELLTMSPSGYEHGRVVGNLTILLGQYVRAKGLGDICGAETGFKLESNPDTVRAPDIAFIPKERVGVRSTGFGSGAPTLAVEVLSPDDRKGKVEQKTLQWLACGAESVWLVNPTKRTVEVIRADGQRKLFHESDELVDDTVPGFRVAVSKIFE
jgi:Uma2 family endonuclease